MKEFELRAIGERCHYETLSNGLTVYVVPKAGYEKAHALLLVNYGGSDERFFLGNRRKQTPAGVAHFLEHKMFDMPEGNALQTLTGRGASPNAFTSNSVTGYHFTCTEQFYDNLRTLLTFVNTPWFTPESVAKERGIIAQEIGMLNDLPDWCCWQNLLQGLYHYHPVRNDLAGTVESISGITPEVLESCYRGFYQPSNMVLCVAGNVSPRQVLNLAAAVVPAGDGQLATRDLGEEEPDCVKEQEIIREMDVTIPKFAFGCKAKSEATLFHKVLGGVCARLLCGASTPLYAKLYQEGLIDGSFSADFNCGNGASFLSFSGQSRNPSAVAEAILSEGVRIAWNGLDEAVFAAVVKGAYGRRVRALDSLEHLCGYLARGHFEGYNDLDFAQVYECITREDAEEFLRNTVTGERSTLSVIIPKGGK